MRPNPSRRSPHLALSLSVLAAFACGQRASDPASPQEEAGAAEVAEAADDDDPSRFFPPPDTQLLLLGTFHFKDPGLDDYKPQHDVDILDPERQGQVEAIVERLADWAPTRIAVEWRAERQAELDERYAAYLAGEAELAASEVEQVAFRLGRRLGHERLWAVDAPARWYEPWVDPDEWAAERGLELPPGVPDWDSIYERWYAARDLGKTRRTLREELLAINREAALERSHGHYLVGSLVVGDGVEYPGADARTAWYNRNLRIFSNLLRLALPPGQRVFVLIGAGHVPILRHAAEASPAIELVEVASIL